MTGKAPSPSNLTWKAPQRQTEGLSMRPIGEVGSHPIYSQLQVCDRLWQYGEEA